ncbi:MAG TPA: twin-arginine translocation signal domain-containing protein, partial [Candidatus Marinimicrobia bacterium]|nr:twin-arginine translocation signal domain-containing protein [Candidatus Neomarinimicrobiota bacterium]
MINRRQFIKGSGIATVGALTLGFNKKSDATKLPQVSGKSIKLLVDNAAHPQPATIDRLPLEWHKGRVKVLQKKLGEKGLDGILITDRWNIIYYTGLFHSTTERPFACFIPTDKMAIHWFYPGLDLELVKSWWITDGEYYFDYPHADGAYPDQGTVDIGPPVDLVKWQLTGLKKRGYGSKKIGLSAATSYKKLKHMKNILPKA